MIYVSRDGPLLTIGIPHLNDVDQIKMDAKRTDGNPHKMEASLTIRFNSSGKISSVDDFLVGGFRDPLREHTDLMQDSAAVMAMFGIDQERPGQ